MMFGISGLFDFIKDADNHEDRLVDRYDGEGFIVDTCAISDSEEPYETGIQHPLYNDDKWIIVETYKTKEVAQKGHDGWVYAMTHELPKQLMDVSTAGVKRLSEALGNDDWTFKRRE